MRRRWLGLPALVLLATSPRAQDCNRNGVGDLLDVASGHSLDCNLNGVPDECDSRPAFRLGAAESFHLGLEPGHLAAADLDEDGLLEVITVNRHRDGANVSVLFNQGSRRFDRRPFSVPFGTDDTSAIEPGDWDRDGHVDLAVTLAEPRAVVFLFGDGQGTLGRAVSRPLGARPLSMTGADFDVDGDEDLAIGLEGGTVLVLSSEGSGAFLESAPLSVPIDPIALLPADIDGDVRYDLAGVSTYGRVFVLAGNGAGAFEEAVTVADPGRRTVGLDAVDVDGDFDLDLALATSEIPGVEIHVNDGGGRFEPGPRVELPALTNTVSGVAAHDWDEDGDEDMVVTARSPPESVYILLNDGRGGIEPTGETIGGINAVSMVSADIDGDGRLDLAMGNRGPDTASILWNEEGGTFLLSRSHAAGNGLVRLVGGDLDADGDLDLAASDSGARAVVVLRNGGGEGFEATPLPTGGATPGALAAGDVEGDGDLDLIALSDSFVDPLRLFRNDGLGGFDGGIGYPGGGREHSFVAPADLDGNGALDLLVGVGGQNPGLAVYWNGDDTLFGAPEVVPTATFPASAATVDLDGDGDIDVAVTQPNIEEVSVMLNGRTGWLSERIIHRLERGPGPLAAADLDNDGDADLVVLCQVPDDLKVLLNRGGGIFDVLPDGFKVLDDPGFITPADVDGDGRVDIITRTGYWSIWVLFGDGRAGFTGARSFPVGSPTNVVALDLDGDDRIDLAAGNGAHVSVLRNLTIPPPSPDTNGDGILDECGRPSFHRGDSNGDGALDITDPFHVFYHLFVDSRPIECREAADSNNDGRVDLSDGLHVLGFLFLGSPPPPTPGPPGTPCGEDPDFPGGPGDIGCAEYAGC